MSRFAPTSFEEAKRNVDSRPQKPRKPLRRGKALSPASSQNGAAGLKRTQIARTTAKSKKAKRTKMPSRKSLVKKADTLVSLIVRLRDDGQCVLWGINANCCGTERLQCGHIFGRRSHGARFDIVRGGNTAAQCANCNIKHNSHQWVFYKWYIDQHGQVAFDELYLRWSKGRKYSRLELIELCAELQAKLTELQALKGTQ